MKRGRNNKNYWPALVLAVLWWLLLVGVVMLVDPEVVADFPISNTYLVFFVLLFLAVFFLVSLLFEDSRRGFLMALLVTVLGYLRLWGLWGWGPVILICGAFIAFEVYFISRKN